MSLASQEKNKDSLVILWIQVGVGPYKSLQNELSDITWNVSNLDTSYVEGLLHFPSKHIFTNMSFLIKSLGFFVVASVFRNHISIEGLISKPQAKTKNNYSPTSRIRHTLHMCNFWGVLSFGVNKSYKITGIKCAPYIIILPHTVNRFILVMGNYSKLAPQPY